MCKSLWPKITAKSEDLPKGILQQQINYLAENTENKIIGSLEIFSGNEFETTKSMKDPIIRSEEDICYKLYITVPSLGNVRFLLVSMLQNPIQIYPCHLKDEINDIEYNNINDLSLFIEKLGQILQSEKITQLLSNLLA